MPPPANNWMGLSLQMSVSFVKVTEGAGKTVINTVSDAAHLLSPMPVTTYCVVVNGDAMGFGICGLERPATGDQLNDVPCVTFICTAEPAQIVVSSLAFITDFSTLM